DVRILVDRDDRMAAIGKAGRGDQTDVADAEDAESHGAISSLTFIRSQTLQASPGSRDGQGSAAPRASPRAGAPAPRAGGTPRRDPGPPAPGPKGRPARPPQRCAGVPPA